MARPVRIAILANGSQARAEIATVTSSLGGLGRLAKTGLAVAGVGGIARGIAGIAKASVGAEAQFSTSMRLIAVNTGAPQQEITKLSDLAIKLGADTVFSAGEASGAMLELAKGGFKTAQIAGGGVQATMALAATEGLELADAATIVGNTMNTFGLKADKASQIADALAAGSAASSASVASLAEGLGNVGATARTSGLTLQETVAALAELDAAGIKGAEGGTALRSFLTQLTPTSTKAKSAVKALGLEYKTADGNFRSLGDISGQLRTKLGGLSEAQRAEALQTLFGTYAKQAAAVFLGKGQKGYEAYTKEVQKSGKAQELADARTRGTAGTLERLSGAVETAQLKIGKALEPAVIRVGDALGDNLLPAAEAVIGGAKDLGTAVAPAVVAITDALDGLIPSAETTGSVFNDQLVPAVSTLADVVADVVGFVDDLPGPVKEIGVEAGIAALVLPRLTAGVAAAGGAFTVASARVTQFGAAMTSSTLRAQTGAAAMARLGTAARGAAGIGGMVALAAGAQTANNSLSFLASTAGGAALGFSLAGPWGAAIGGAGGALYGLASASTATAVETVKVKDTTAAYVDVLDELTGALGAAAKARIYDRLMSDKNTASLITEVTAAGVNRRDIINATLGKAGAIERLRAAQAAFNVEAQKSSGLRGDPGFNEQGDAARVAAGYIDLLLPKLGAENGVLRASVRASREKALATQNLGKVLAGLPPQVQTKVVAAGVDITQRQIAQLTRRYSLAPKQIRTIITSTGADTTVKQVQRVVDKLNLVGKAKPDLKGFKDSVATSSNAAEQTANKGGLNIAKALKQGTSKSKADLGPFRKSLAGQIGQVQPTAKTGGLGIGGALKSGILIGFDGTATELARRAAAAVRAGVAAGRAEGDINSPSRKTQYIGEMLGEGLAVGLRAKTAPVSTAMLELVNGALGSIAALGAQSTSGVAAGNVETAVTAVTDLIATTYSKQLDTVEKVVNSRLDKQAKRAKKTLKGKAETRALARIDKQRDNATKAAGQASNKAQATTNAGLAGQYASLRSVAGQYDAINEQLDEARQKYDDLVQQSQSYAASVRDSVVAFGSITSLGGDTGFSSIEQLVSLLEGKVATAETYSGVIQSLTAAGLNQTSLQQLIDAGVEGGLGTAQAILAGGPAAIAQINTLTGKLVTAGTTLGTITANAMYGAGIQAAAGLAAGLESQAATLQTQALAIGQSIAAGLAAGLAAQTAPKAATKQADLVIKASKKKLKTNSPSRVFIGIGRNVSQGLAIGLDDVYVQRKATKLAGSLEKGFGTPALDAYLASGAGVGAAAQGNTYITVQATPGTDKVALAKELRSIMVAGAQQGVKF